jgi:hypothetical protein
VVERNETGRCHDEISDAEVSMERMESKSPEVV